MVLGPQSPFFVWGSPDRGLPWEPAHVKESAYGGSHGPFDTLPSEILRGSDQQVPCFPPSLRDFLFVPLRWTRPKALSTWTCVQCVIRPPGRRPGHL